MRLHPSLQVRSSEALEIINCSTLLLLQAVARTAARGKAPGQHVHFDDLREACLGARELQFLHPLHCTLDASARVMRKDSVAAGTNDTDPATGEWGSSGTGGPAKPGVQHAPAPERGQRVLDQSTFAVARESAGAPVGSVLVETSSDRTPEPLHKVGSEVDRHHVKRKAPASAQKSANKAPRRIASGSKQEATFSDAPSISSFFKRLSDAK